MRKFDRNTFYATARIKGRPWNAARQSGCDYLLSRFEQTEWPIEWIAYALATIAHETAYTFEPIVERGSRRYFDKYEAGTRIGKRLGNIYTGDGFTFRGRGYVQLTGRTNYARYRIADNPNAALDRETAFHLMVDGMENGVFTGKKLSDYITGRKKDYLNARRIINGLDKAEEIASLAVLFEKALRESLREGEQIEQTSATVSSSVAVEGETVGTVVTTDATDAASPLPSITEKLNTAETVATKADTISRSSLWTTISTKIGGWGFLLLGFIQDNWVELLIGAVLIGVAVWYFSRSKDRLQERRLNPW